MAITSAYKIYESYVIQQFNFLNRETFVSQKNPSFLSHKTKLLNHQNESALEKHVAAFALEDKKIPRIYPICELLQIWDVIRVAS